MTEQPYPVALCPAPECESKVKILASPPSPEGAPSYDGRLNFCCLNCWRWTWENGVMNSVPHEPDGSVTPEHSLQCLGRQKVRADYEVTEGNFNLVQVQIPQGQMKQS